MKKVTKEQYNSIIETAYEKQLKLAKKYSGKKKLDKMQTDMAFTEAKKIVDSICMIKDNNENHLTDEGSKAFADAKILLTDPNTGTWYKAWKTLDDGSQEQLVVGLYCHKTGKKKLAPSKKTQKK